MAKGRWDQSDNPNVVARGASWRIVVYFVAFLVVAGIIGGGIWAVKVATSEIRGAGDATRITNDGRNQINSQEWFVGQHAQILAADIQLDEAKANLDATLGKADEAFWRATYTGIKNRCVQMVAAYNAETLKISRGKWRDDQAPYQINANDPQTDCKEKEPTR